MKLHLKDLLNTLVYFCKKTKLDNLELAFLTFNIPQNSNAYFLACLQCFSIGLFLRGFLDLQRDIGMPCCMCS